MRHSQHLLCAKRLLQSAALLVFVISPGIARADPLVIWNFNDANLIADHGTGTLTTTANPADITFSTGTLLNSRLGDPAGLALNIQGGAGLQNNGSSLELRVSTLGFQDIVLSWASQRSDTGFDLIVLQGSIDGTTFFDLGAGSPLLTGEFGSTSILFAVGNATLFFNNPNVAFRFVLTGATAANGSLSFDNIVVEGTPCRDATCGVQAAVPEPATMLLLGTGLLVLGMKARQRLKRPGAR